MKVILLENVKNLGKLGQIAKVAAGYARNFLIPFKKALPATQGNIDFFEKQKAELELKAQERLQQAQNNAKAFAGLSLVIREQANEEGKLFGSVTIHEVLKAFADKGHALSKHEVKLADAIREIGKYQIEVRLHPEVSVDVALTIEPAISHK